jgi:two-component system OmpR family sensor kinase
MKRAPSALVLIGGFGVAVAALSVATTAAVVLFAPQPSAMRMSGASALAALRGDVSGYQRRYESAPPAGTRAQLIEQTLSAGLRVPPGNVRAVWLDSGRDRAPHNVAGPSYRFRRAPDGFPSPARSLPVGRVSNEGRSNSFVLVEGRKGSFQMVAPNAMTGATLELLLSLPMPAFAASVLQSDGRWLSIHPVRPILSGWQLNVIIALAVSLMLLAPLAWLFARRLTRPFRVLASSLGASPDAVLGEGPRELREAAAAISAMRSKLAAEATERARMLTAIAHDLRTPLTGLRLRIEAAPEPQRARMVSDVDRMQAMIGEVLTFARDVATPSELIEIRPLVAAILSDMCAADPEVQLRPGDDVRIRVPVPAFQRAIENLVRNTIHYAGGGQISVQRMGNDAVVLVTDDGPGIPIADRERLIQPFERGDASRNRATGGTGLGLSIVRNFAAQHDGSFTLSGASGGGTIAELRLPAGQPSAPQAQ